jgi:hypothetical protein
MADIGVLIQKLNRYEAEVKLQMPIIVKEMAGVALSYQLVLIRRNGGLLSNDTYSDNPGVPAYLYRGKDKDYPKALNAAGRKYIDRKIKEGEKYNAKKGQASGGSRFNPFLKAGYINWKGLRAAQGLQTSKVDLTYTGRMLQNINVIDVRVIGNIYQAVLGGTDRETRDKLKYNRKRYGDFLKFSEQAITLARKRGNERLKELYKQIVLT